MAGIGEYVHYRFRNYQKFGLGQGQPGHRSAAAALVQAREDLRLLKRNTSATINTKEIEKFLNDLTYSNVDASLKNLSLTAEEIQQHQDYFVKLVQQKMPHLEKVLNTLNLGEKKTYGKISGLSQIPLNNQQSVHRGATVGKAQNELMKLFKTLEAKREQLKKGTIQRRELNQMMLEAKRLYYRLGELNKAEARKMIKYTDTTKHGEFSARELFEQYNQLIKLASQPTKKDYGDIAELYFQYMISAASGMGQAQLNELITPLTIGSKHQATIGIPDLSTKLNIQAAVDALNQPKTQGGKIQNKWTSKNNQGFTVNLSQKGSTSQQTVDIVIDFSDNKEAVKAFGLEKLRASIKNVQSLSNIRILSEAPLTSAFGLLDTNFTNHYLNLIASHPDGTDTRFIEPYNETIGMAFAVRALSGIRYRGNYSGTELSDCLIVNQRSKGIRVVDTQTLLNNTYHNFAEYINITGMPSSSINQTWIGYKSKPNLYKAYTRIAKLIASVHAFKISLSLKKLP